MFENRPRFESHAVPRHDREADALAEPCIANRECRRLFDRIMPQRERLDGGRMNVAAAADDHILLTAGGLCHGNSIEHALEPRLAKRHAAATASCHSAVASARKIRSVDREMRWR